MICSAPDCLRARVARGMCLMHYKRARRLPAFVPMRAQGAGLRFLASISATDQCIEYPFGRFSTGYGHVKMDGRSRTAHAAAYEIHVGPIPPGMEICHNCGNRPCVNPRHLRADSHVGNMADCVTHGTLSAGERNGVSKLRRSDVSEIRAAASKGVPQKGLAATFGVSTAQVSRIVRGTSWKVAG